MKSVDVKVPKIDFPEGIFTFYLSHPAASRHYIRAWELDFERRNPDIALINPFYDVSGEGREDIKCRDSGKVFLKTPGYEWRLFQRDMVALAFSRGILGIVDYNSDKSYGTLMEFVYGRMLAKNPKLLICTNRDHEHPWLKTHFHSVYTDFGDFEKEVRGRVEHVREKWGF